MKILFHAKTYEKCLLTTLTGIFNKISPIVVPLSRSREISHEMTGAILPILSSILCLMTPKLKDKISVMYFFYT